MTLDVDSERLFAESVAGLFARHCPVALVRALRPGAWSGELWEAVVAAELPMLGIDEADGGTVTDATIALRAAARHAAPIPLAETLVANWLLVASGHKPGNRSLSIAWGVGDRSGFHASAVPFARHVDGLVLVDRSGPCVAVGTVERSACELDLDLDLADMASDAILAPASSIVWRTLPDIDGELPDALLAAVRGAQIAGALEAVVALTVRQVRDREQFGRPLAALPQVRERLAVLRGEAAATAAAMAVAAQAAPDPRRRMLAIAVAVRAARAAGLGARLAHQLHGAIGMSAEHELHLLTRRLLVWGHLRGGAHAWARAAGQTVADQGSAGFWPALVEDPGP